jgi:hypothetical protein
MSAVRALLLGIALSTAAHADEAKPAPPTPRATTIHEEQVSAATEGITDGKLILKTEPPRQLPLDELSRVDFGNMPTLTARWLGQDNRDVAQAKPVDGPSGIQDLHVQITGLIRNRPFKQIILSQGFYLWKSDTGKTKNWKLVVDHTPGSGTADLYAEPLKADRKDADFHVTVIYSEGDKAVATVKATTSTDNTLKVVANEGQPPVPVAAGTQAVVVHFEDGSELSGQLEGLGKEALRLKTVNDATLDIPLLLLRGVWFESAGGAKAKIEFTARLKKPAAEDTAFVRSQDQSVTEIAGEAQEVRDQKLRFAYQGETRSINIARLVGLVFAAHPPSAPVDRPYQIVQLASGDRIAGVWSGLTDAVLEWQLPWGDKLPLPVATVSSVDFRNGKLTYVSDLEPASIEEVAYFDRAMPHRRDRNLSGEPLKLKGAEYRKGIAVHSRTVLTYAIDGKYATFKTVVGFDESAPKRGRVACRVLGDDRELFVEKDLRADQDPKPLELDVKGIAQLTLEIDFGEEENICDRVIWASARLYRE